MQNENPPLRAMILGRYELSTRFPTRELFLLVKSANSLYVKMRKRLKALFAPEQRHARMLPAWRRMQAARRRRLNPAKN
jgi:hypothetical protein